MSEKGLYVVCVTNSEFLRRQKCLNLQIQKQCKL
jgi:hypothetical protein